jgi:hypothetical protein
LIAPLIAHADCCPLSTPLTIAIFLAPLLAVALAPADVLELVELLLHAAAAMTANAVTAPATILLFIEPAF